MRRTSLLITLLFLLTFFGTTALAQKAVLQTDCGKIDCEEKGPHFYDKYGPGNWTDAGAECICRYYTSEGWELVYCSFGADFLPAGAGPSPEEELQIWRDCGVPVPGGPLSGSWGWAEEEEEYEIHRPADFTQLTFLDHASDPDWSSDGSQIVFDGEDKDVQGVYLINSDGTGFKKIIRCHCCDPSWSPVDNRIAYHVEEGGGLRLINLDNPSSKVTLTKQFSELSSWSPDGKKIAYNIYNEDMSFSSIWVMNSDGSGKVRLTTDEDDFCTAPSFSYDGSKIVYLKGFTSYVAGGEENIEPNEIWVMDSNGSNKHMIYAPGDSTQLIFQRAWNKDNKILFMRGWYHRYPAQIWIINSDGSDPKPVVSGSDVFGDPVWDNTGTKVTISRIAPPSIKGSNIWVFSYEKSSEEEEEVIEEPKEEVERAPKNIFQKIWEAIINFFKRIFRI